MKRSIRHLTHIAGTYRPKYKSARPAVADEFETGEQEYSRISKIGPLSKRGQVGQNRTKSGLYEKRETSIIPNSSSIFELRKNAVNENPLNSACAVNPGSRRRVRM